MTFKVKEGVQVGSTLALDANGKLTTGLSTGRSISLSGDVAGSATFDGTSNITISTTVQPNSVALGTDTTGNYMLDVTAGTGVSVSHTQGEGSTAVVSIGQPVAITDNVTFANINASGNLVIDGNLTVNGTTTTISATNLAIEDNLIYLNEGSTAANPDLGITGNYNDGTYAHTGVFRDATDNRWKFFKGYTPEPSTSIDTTHASFTYADVQAGTFYGAFSGNLTGNVTGAVTGNATTASTWQTARTLSYTGDATGSMSVDGSANVSTALTLANSGVTAGSYGSGTAIPVLTIDAKGRITAASTSAVTIGNSGLTLSIGTAGATNTTVTIGIGTGFTANATSAYTYDIKVGPALTNLATLMTTAGAGFIKRGATADTYTIDTNTYLTGTKVDSISATTPIVASASTGAVTLSHASSGVTAGTYNNVTVNATGHVTSASNVSYLTSESDTLATVTGRGASTSTTVALNGGAGLGDGWLYFNDTQRDVGAATYYPNVQTRAVRFIFANASTANSGGNYAGVMQFNPWSGTTASTGDASYQLSFGSTATNGGGVPKLSIRKGIDTTWNSWYTVPLYGVNSYSSTLYGTVFYDADNTAYYCDPNSRSNLSTLNTGGATIASGMLNVYNGGAGGVGWGTGFNMGDSSNYTSWIQDGGVDRRRNYGTGGWDWYNSGASKSYWGDNSGNSYASASFRAPIFYDNDNTSYYTDPASTSQLNYAVVQNHIDSAGTRFTTPAGGSYTSSSGTVTGAFKIKLPTDRNNSSTMVQFGVTIYEYSTGQTHQFRISGYNYGGGNWYNWAATQLTDGGRGALTIRWGYDSTGDCVWIGETNTSWSYPQVFVTDVQTGYGGFSNNWGAGWSISLITTFDTVEQSRTASLVKTANNASNWGFADYGTIWYDTDNTGYYTDPASTSYVNWLQTAGSLRSNNHLYLDQNYGSSVVGAYNSYRYQGIYSMGDSYKLSLDGTTVGNLYGLAWSHPNAGGAAANLASHGWLLLENGSFKTACGGGRITTTADIRGTIYYDYDNTAYYCDPASTSVFNQINLNTGGTAKMLWRAAGSGTPGIGAPFYWNSATGSIVIEVSDNDTGGVVIDNEGVTVFGAGDTGGVFRVIDEDSYQSLLNVTNATCFQINQGAGGGGYIRGDFTATGNLIAQSDIRLKYDIEPIDNALEKVLAIRGITYRMQGALNPSRNVGVIAQEVEAVLPEAVRENEEGIKSVAYGNMVGLLVEAIKEQQSEIDELKALVKQLLAK